VPQNLQLEEAARFDEQQHTCNHGRDNRANDE
jgi:hypothetical protein